MEQTTLQAFSGFATCLGVLLLCVIGFAHVLAGSRGSRWVLKLYSKTARNIIGLPIFWAGQILVALGRAIQR